MRRDAYEKLIEYAETRTGKMMDNVSLVTEQVAREYAIFILSKGKDVPPMPEVKP